MGLLDKLSTASGKAFGHIGLAIKKVEHIGGKAVRIAGSIGNGVAGRQQGVRLLQPESCSAY
jgi:hypothetical protein